MAPALQTPVRQESKEDIDRETDRKLSREQTERMLVDVRKRVRKQKAKTWTIDPVRCREAQWWDAVICLALVYTALVPPAEVAFTPPQKKVRVNALFCINQVINFIFFADMVLQFFLHVQLPKHKGGVWIRNHKKIVKRYLKGAFFVDFVSIIPFSALTFTGIKIFNNLQMARLLRLLRLMKLLRMFRGSRLIMRYRASMTLSITGANLIGFIIFTVLASHWLACIQLRAKGPQRTGLSDCACRSPSPAGSPRSPWTSSRRPQHRL